MEEQLNEALLKTIRLQAHSLLTTVPRYFILNSKAKNCQKLKLLLTLNTRATEGREDHGHEGENKISSLVGTEDNGDNHHPE